MNPGSEARDQKRLGDNMDVEFYPVGDPADRRFPKEALRMLVKNLQKAANDSNIVAADNDPTDKKFPYSIKIDSMMRLSFGIYQWEKKPNSYYMRIQAKKQTSANVWEPIGDFCGYASGSFFNLGTGKAMDEEEFEYFYNEYMREKNLT